jgi:hypothetical protein
MLTSYDQETLLSSKLTDEGFRFPGDTMTVNPYTKF